MSTSIFRQEARVKLYYLIGKMFPAAQFSRAGYGQRGGEKQAELEQRLRERLGVLRLAKGQAIDEILKTFILESSDEQMTKLLELIPEVAYPNEGDTERRVGIRQALEEFLDGIAGVKLKFGPEGRLRLDESFEKELAAQRPRVDPLETQFGNECRVAIFYLLEEHFEPVQFHGMFDGYVGGGEQEMLEESLRKTLHKMELAEGRSIAEILKKFITETGRPRELLTMLELMPVIRYEFTQRHYNSQKARHEAELVEEAIETELKKLGIEMRFTTDGKLEEASVDTTPRALKELPSNDELTSRLPVALSDNPVVSVVSLDLDNFKAVNDRHGHDGGDECLARFAELTGGIVKGKGRLFRSYKAGDEFSVLLPNFDRAEALALAERIRKAVESSDIGHDVRVTASIGVVTSGVGDASDLVTAADEAAFAAKFSGKNRVVAWPLEPELAAAVRAARDRAKGR